MNRLPALSTLAIGILLTASPAMAGVNPVTVPEPGTMSLLGVGIAAAYVIKRVGRRKK